MTEHKPITDAELQEVFDRAHSATETGFDDLTYQVVSEDVPRLVSEVKRLRQNLVLIQRNRFLVGELAYITARDALGNAGKSYDQIYGDPECTSV